MIYWVRNNLLNQWAEASRTVLDPNEAETCKQAKCHTEAG